MRLCGGLPGQLAARPQRTGAGLRQRRLVVEELADRGGEALRRRRARRRGPRRTRAPARRGRRRRRRPPARRRRARGAGRRSGRARGGTGRRRRSTRRARGRSPPRCRNASASPATRSCAPGTRETASRACSSCLYGRTRPSASTVRPSSARAGSLGVTGWGITRSFSSGTPNAASVSRPRSEWTTIRSKRPKARRQRPVFPAVRRGSRSCAVSTSGARWRSSHESSSGTASHCTWTTSAGVAARRARPSGCSSTFSGTRSRERPKRRDESG